MREMRGVVMKEKFFGAMKEIGVVELARFLQRELALRDREIER